MVLEQQYDSADLKHFDQQALCHVRSVSSTWAAAAECWKPCCTLRCNVTWMRAGGYLSNVGQCRLHCIHGAAERRAGKLQGHNLLKADRDGLLSPLWEPPVCSASGRRPKGKWEESNWSIYSLLITFETCKWQWFGGRCFTCIFSIYLLVNITLGSRLNLPLMGSPDLKVALMVNLDCFLVFVTFWVKPDLSPHLCWSSLVRYAHKLGNKHKSPSFDGIRAVKRIKNLYIISTLESSEHQCMHRNYLHWKLWCGAYISACGLVCLVVFFLKSSLKYSK